MSVLDKLIEMDKEETVYSKPITAIGAKGGVARKNYYHGGILDINESEEIISDDGNDIELTDYNAVDCGVFKCRYDFFSILASAREKGNYSLSEACEILISKNNLGGVNIGDSFWIDIDTPEALEYCRLNGQMLRPV